MYKTIILHMMSADRLESFAIVFDAKKCRETKLKCGEMLIVSMCFHLALEYEFTWCTLYKSVALRSLLCTLRPYHTDQCLRKHTIDRSLIFVILNNSSSPFNTPYYSICLVFFRFSAVALEFEVISRTASI